MEKKFRFSDKTTLSKLLYAGVIVALCVGAIVVGIVAANNRKQPQQTTPPDDVTEPNEPSEPTTPNDPTNPSEPSEPTDPSKPQEGKLSFVSPTIGTVYKSHSSTLPVFSDTLEEWRTHEGIDISTEEGAKVYAVAAGTITRVFEDPMMGVSVEIKHSDNVSSLYSNLAKESVQNLKAGDTVAAGEQIACIGDTTIYELADEAHLHFEILVKGESVNPLDYISEEAKKASLKIENESAA